MLAGNVNSVFLVLFISILSHSATGKNVYASISAGNEVFDLSVVVIDVSVQERMFATPLLARLKMLHSLEKYD